MREPEGRAVNPQAEGALAFSVTRADFSDSPGSHPPCSSSRSFSLADCLHAPDRRGDDLSGDFLDNLRKELILRQARLAAQPPVSQEDLSGRLADFGVTLDQGAISRVESEERYLMDYELLAIAKALRIKPSSWVD